MSSCAFVNSLIFLYFLSYLLIIRWRGRFMDGEGTQEEAVLTAVKPLKAIESSANTGNSSWPAARAQVADGNVTLGELFNQHHDGIFPTAYRVTSSAEDAEDILRTT